ncbi:hypothetical protein A3D84_05400 [Candidatus Woesebacteria bacterium RIFCSPHIGHO2_02_FULL_42_20]|uniref:Uncharacterized protein n=1 Tax=Candidatus Woesebacteria bacterium RIFCSPHIGHO2_12_FULL_41_24 TaxID=1802510 RepID=A0A1F8APR8_9BACT|nr:MAG: hypothetical protein A2W15_04610 [Candidatus Woesebacteria bacterium RBG_16_41_13]OGM34625.1 MAG: hypothetical protein A3D84_05400 [Candidatus Woesebacteria bacterium RIFCSPHIGHO2_02_FULL_42_20]OGM53777.1 MAG: hypothetical protein A3E44_05155 [Candidatus Woesebacteria bacterium RIFCSPHIGHO2_12_FULL_41_24]OGM66310.1 MAG: hypothetical protein A2969_01810 [Candidatus Woesebacteria bacterium RIFCSPLOWO2_01_FULL_42_67]OGM71186.1 MAG: hypothetical protein A3I55_05180 [Candidatus Woesebacteria
MIIVTSGTKYTDVDVLACATAYSDLLNLLNKPATAVLYGPLNASITKTVKSWKLNYKSRHSPKPKDCFVLVDTSNPDVFLNKVNLDNVIEIYDHHFGWEKYWSAKLGRNSHIEHVGACATLIWEEFRKKKLTNKVSKTSARLLLTAIVSNTLNFKSSVTINRDKNAYKELSKYARLGNNWAQKYFREVEENVYQNPDASLKNDSKGLSDIAIGQIELWDSSKFFSKYLPIAKKVLTGFGNPKWFLTSPSISEGVNYIYSENDEVKFLLSKHIGAKFEGDIGKTRKLWLRKEILKVLNL